jgi:hypothetical protein
VVEAYPAEVRRGAEAKYCPLATAKRAKVAMINFIVDFWGVLFCLK